MKVRPGEGWSGKDQVNGFSDEGPMKVRPSEGLVR